MVEHRDGNQLHKFQVFVINRLRPIPAGNTYCIDVMTAQIKK